MQLVVQRADPVSGRDRLRDVREPAILHLELEALRQQPRELVAGDARCSGAEHGHEPAGRQGAHHLVVVILERRLRDADERPLLTQDRPVERLELRTGLDPELVDERAARVAVRRERIGLSARPVEREHQLRAEPLPQRMPRDEQLQLRHELGVDLELEIGRDPILEYAQPQILQAMDVVLREVLQLRVGKRPASPESKRLAEHGRPPLGLFLPRRAEDVLETGEIELTSIKREHVAVRPCLEETGSQQLSQLRDGVLEGRRRSSRRMLSPELIDETLSRDRLVRPQEQQRQQRALVATAERQCLLPVAHLEGTEDPELEHCVTVVTGFTFL